MIHRCSECAKHVRTKDFHFRMSKIEFDRLRREADQRRMKMGVLVREAIDKYLPQKPIPQDKRILELLRQAGGAECLN